MPENKTYNEMIREDVPNMPERLIKQSFEALEHNYDITQRAKMEAMHNEIVRVINESDVRPEHALFALKIVESEIVNSCAAMFFAPPPQTRQTPSAAEPEDTTEEETDIRDDMEETAVE